jgi:hypothetical protein
MPNIELLNKANKRIAELEDELANQDLVNERIGDLHVAKMNRLISNSTKDKQQAIRDAISNSEQVELQGQGYIGTYVSLEDLEVNILQLGVNDG